MTHSDAPGAVTEDSLLGGRVRLLQPVDGYRAAVDPVLLAASAPTQNGDHVLDLGCGAGAIALCLLARVPDLRVTGIEKVPQMCALAERNAALNNASDRFKTCRGRIETRPPAFEQGAFDLVVSNPPYLESKRADLPENILKAAAHAEGEVPLIEWVDAAHLALRHKGRFCMIHRADRLADILAAMKHRFGGIEVHPLFPKPGRDAKRLIVMARKGIRTPLSLSSGIVLHNIEGSYTPPVAAALDGARLVLGRSL